MRDIAVRHAVRDVSSLRQLTTYLITNSGNPVYANKLAGMFGIKSPATILEYFPFLEDAYPVCFVPLFSHSLKVQARNPKKVYVMDMGLYSATSLSTSDNLGRRFENLVFIHLRRTHKKIFYYRNKGECDFVVMEKNEVKEAIQVCLKVDDENFGREYNGLLEAMQHLRLKEGSIITLNQSDKFESEEKTIRMIPASEFLNKTDLKMC